jgi:muconolactone D-isomerase
MLFHVRMTVSLPGDIDAAWRKELLDAEKQYSRRLQQSGQWLHLWRVAGQQANISVFDVESVDALHDILWNLPLFPFLTLDIVPLATHPSAIASGARAAGRGE